MQNLLNVKTRITNQNNQYHQRWCTPWGTPPTLNISSHLHWNMNPLITKSAINVFLSLFYLLIGSSKVNFRPLLRGQSHSTGVKSKVTRSLVTSPFLGAALYSPYIDSSLITLIFHTFCLGLPSLTLNRLMSERFPIFVIQCHF